MHHINSSVPINITGFNSLFKNHSNSLNKQKLQKGLVNTKYCVLKPFTQKLGFLFIQPQLIVMTMDY